MIWPTAVVKQSPIHWFGSLTRYVEVLWRTTNELRVGVLGIDRGGSDLTLDYARAYSSMPRPLEHAKAARACSCATLRRDYWRGGHRYYRRVRRLVGPEGVSAGVTGGDSAAVTGEAREELSEGREEALPEGSSAGITGGGDCRHDRRRRALSPPRFPFVTPALSSSGNACSRTLSQLLRSPLRSRHMRGEPGEPGEGCFT